MKRYTPPAAPAVDDTTPSLESALEDAEFLLRKLAANPSEATIMRGSIARCAGDARAALEKARREGVTP